MCIMSVERDTNEKGRFEILAENIDKRLGKLAKLVRTKPSAGKYYEVIFDELSHNFNNLDRPIKPNWFYRNEQAGSIALRKLDIIFVDAGDADYKPNLSVSVGRREIVKPHKEDMNPFKSVNLTLDTRNGIELESQETIEIFVWGDNEDVGSKKFIVAVELGEA